MIENVNALLNTDIHVFHIVLPLAISFFTFQQIAYLIDAYREEKSPYPFLDYTLFVTFFPQLIAGPIVHHKEMMPQFLNPNNDVKKYELIAKGFFIFSIGLFKKVVIADAFSKWATIGFDTEITLNLLSAWAVSLSYTFQLYFDFSGYTDMAIGLALLFNIKLPINFNSPYKALTIQDFWRRWHITLSRFLKNYIYIPLGGNKKTELKTYTYLLITFLLGGLWHGAGWTFVFWGFLHGIALIIHRIWHRFGFSLWKWLAWFITFNFVNIAWIFFRAKEWEDAIRVLGAMFSFKKVVLPFKFKHFFSFLSNDVQFSAVFRTIGTNEALVIFLVFTFITVLGFKNSNQKLCDMKVNIQSYLFSAILFSIAILSFYKVSTFLYFNF
jgi:D-alanyl-lipoteichoic acid acyltransferase DltB (MBOAT superfamily)